MRAASTVAVPLATTEARAWKRAARASSDEVDGEALPECFSTMRWTARAASVESGGEGDEEFVSWTGGAGRGVAGIVSKGAGSVEHCRQVGLRFHACGCREEGRSRI